MSVNALPRCKSESRERPCSKSASAGSSTQDSADSLSEGHRTVAPPGERLPRLGGMNIRFRSALLAVTLASTAPLAGALPIHLVPLAEGVDGSWVFEAPVPGQIELAQVALVLQSTGGSSVTGMLQTDDGAFPGSGSWDTDSGRLEFRSEPRPGMEITISAALQEDLLVGTLELFRSVQPIEARRGERAPPGADVVFDSTVESPVTVSLAGLGREVAWRIDTAIRRVVESRPIVGLSAAFVVDGELVDVRSYGWEDFGERVPASGDTMYRWASIAKALTAVAALQLVEQGDLDLDADARMDLPEFPEQEHVFSSRQLLGHQAGIVHYQHMGLRTLREYDVEHPWADPILAMDMFNERPLLFEPGSEYSYSTPGFVILGAVIDRAGEGSYVQQVDERICESLGMTTMQPDYEWVSIPHRSRGYVDDGEGQIVDSGSDDISWKLAAGGWISSVGDLARFGAGLMGDRLLEPETREEMFTAQLTSTGSETGYGLGIRVDTSQGELVVSHGGAQRKASSFLLVCPERRLAVALMSNTQGPGLADLARQLLDLLLE